MIITGTSYFISRRAALRYYNHEHATWENIEQKIREGLIHIGKPELKPGQTLRIIDSARYAIVDER